MINISYKVKDIPESERPRERLLEVGVDNLSNQELLAIILKTGTKTSNAKDIALDILTMYPSINDLKNISVPNLKKIKGIGEVKAIELIASIELGKRIGLSTNSIKSDKYINAKQIYESFLYLFHGKKQEYFYCLYFNNKQKLISKRLLFIGTINNSTVHPREIFKEAYLLSASSIVCLHNHPSNDTTPSSADIEFTNTLVSIGSIQGIPVVDHIIITDNEYYSLYENKNI